LHAKLGQWEQPQGTGGDGVSELTANIRAEAQPDWRAGHVVGYVLLVLHAAVSVFLAPASLGPWKGLLFGTFYMLMLWLIMGVFVSDILHLGISHRALDFTGWFSQAVALSQNLIGVYVNPIMWVRRHRLHHIHSDRDGDPNKLPSDDVWKMLYKAFFPVKAQTPEPPDAILATWPFRLVSTDAFAIFSQVSSYAFLWLLVRDWKYALGLWISVRLISLWGYLIINYWSHDRRFGPRRYDEDDNDTVNIPYWLPITLTFSGCWHNNHHHSPHLLRMTHDESEYDLGLMSVRVFKKLGLVKASPTGTRLPPDIPLRKIGF
jgi:stearoyl-CoA desaturase (delta-9 desaturase)